MFDTNDNSHLTETTLAQAIRVTDSQWLMYTCVSTGPRIMVELRHFSMVTDLERNGHMIWKLEEKISTIHVHLTENKSRQLEQCNIHLGTVHSQ